jgi:anti-sigma factor RsiW
MAEIGAALKTDPDLATLANALRQDRDALAAAFAPAAADKLPQAWLDRIEAAIAPGEPSNILQFRPRPAPKRPPLIDRAKLRAALPWALAACLALAVASPAVRHLVWPAADTIEQEAAEARSGILVATSTLQGPALPSQDDQRALLRRVTGLPVQAPDLRPLGWHLATLETFPAAAELRYRNQAGELLTMYVRRSRGEARFDLLQRGHLRTCVWQDDVMGTVIIGDMSAGKMMRVAALAYTNMNHL